MFVSSTWLDLQDERKAIDDVLRRFVDAKFIGMEDFGADEGTTREASLAAVERTKLYIGIIGGRYGSGITEAEYDAARALDLPCFIYVKKAAAVIEDGRDREPEKRERLTRLLEKLRDQRTGHLVAEFAGPGELVVMVAANLHNWLFAHHLSLALEKAHQGSLPAEGTRTLGDQLARFADLNGELIELVSEKREVSREKRRLALDILYKLTYEVREQLQKVPGMTERREEIASSNLRALERLVALDPQDHEMLRELATNWRLVGETRIEQEDWTGAREAFEKSRDLCGTLLKLAPEVALYQRDHAVSHSNLGYIDEERKQPAAARREYEIALQSARRATELDPRWQAECEQIDAAHARLRGQ